MKAVWIAFIVGIFVGASVGIIGLAMFLSDRPYDHCLPDMEDIEAGQ